ncbi:unnamed protein product [Coffea canephora]|uniref:Uncharacterized protein n=1 Tax=Coffea canephora TaxID=49390 RepID=A0A068UQB4_COFCA|nr:unnamed protein product [Coffea canephora]
MHSNRGGNGAFLVVIMYIIMRSLLGYHFSICCWIELRWRLAVKNFVADWIRQIAIVILSRSLVF